MCFEYLWVIFELAPNSFQKWHKNWRAVCGSKMEVFYVKFGDKREENGGKQVERYNRAMLSIGGELTRLEVEQ